MHEPADDGPGHRSRDDGTAMEAEFDTVARWTADAAVELGPDHFLPAACRGSGSPGAMRWLLDRLAVGGRDTMLDCGAGLGGPAAFATGETGARLLLCDPEAGACRGAARLFGLPAVRADSRLPFRSAAVDVAWSLGVLCTVDDQPLLLSELRRVLRPGGRMGLLIYVAAHPPLPEQPEGNDFPTDTVARAMIDAAGFTLHDSATTGDMAAAPPEWTERAVAVQDLLERRHGDDPRWRTAARQSGIMGRLLGDGDLVGTLYHATAR
ncbi:class I SAM-dependent methyltransferase [Nakamurella leprariae]|uniref:Methyltransferase domain-containing protein n=1 Tax=Nakamurella leprariae TaxID=2803911 RepID=A0A938YDE2_9ACTN|nr:methyltransferase domain-containing protein [Nakamurella leprariae]MBM9467779.1 methyltransferase domain-containing protein [Nakamurella leprariae]